MKQKNKFKKTEIGMIPESWKIVVLSQVADIVSGGTPKTSVPEYWIGNIPWISVADFGRGIRWIRDTEKHISAEGLKNSPCKVLQKGQLIISARGTVGEIGQVAREMAFNQSCYGLIGKSGIDNNFLFYLLRSKVRDIQSKTHGSVFSTITRQTFDQLIVALPDLDEQHRITKILSDLDSKIELNNQMNKTLEAIGQSLFEHWFIDFEFPNEHGKPYKSSGGKMAHSEELKKEVPEGWELAPLGQVSDIRIGRTPPRMQEHWFSHNPDDIPWISIKDLGDAGTYISHSSEYLTREAVEKFKIPMIPPNTVVLSFKLTVGRVAISTTQMLSNEAIAQINPLRSELTPEYTYLFLKKYNFSQLGSTSSIATAINSQSIRQIQIIIPPSQIATQFQSLVRHIFAIMLQSGDQSATIEEIRYSLLPKLMSGQIRVHVND